MMSNSPLKSVFISAGAGTGKTYSLIEKVSYLFEYFTQNHKRAPRLIVCTFTRKASQELKERLFHKAIGHHSNSIQNPEFLNYIHDPSLLLISTIDGILNHFLKRYRHTIGLSPDFEISQISSNDKLFDSLSDKFIYEKNFSLLKKIPYPYLKELLLWYYKKHIQYESLSFYDKKDFEDFNKERSYLINSKNKFKGEEVLSAYLKDKPLSLLNKLESSCKVKELIENEESFLEEDFISFFKEFQTTAEEFVIEFLEKKKESSVLDIEDLLLMSYHLLKEKPEIAQTFSKEWDYWLVDEYQDTSFLQGQVIEKITAFNNVFCVGDFAQSIYAFRGAEPEVFKQTEEKVIKQGGDVKKLDTNRRSSKALIAFYNDFFSGDDFIKLNFPAKDDKTKSCISFLTYPSGSKEKTAQKALSLYIKQLKSEGVSYSDIAILSSNNKDIVSLASFLRSEGLPIMLYSSRNFSHKRLITDSLFLLKFLINPYDDINLKALLRTPYFRMPDQDLAQSSYEHKNEQEEISFWIFLKNKYKDNYSIQSLDTHLEDYKKYGLFESFKRAVFDSGMMDLSYKKDATFSSTANLWKLLHLLKNSNLSSLELFYQLIEERAEDSFQETPSGEDEESLQLMTIHKSKGLEFEHVIVWDSSITQSDLKSSVGKQEMIFDTRNEKLAFSVPLKERDGTKTASYGHSLYNKWQAKKHFLERERLFYVAMTRAKQSLALFIPHVKKSEKNSWLKERLPYFKKIKNLYLENSNEKTWELKEGEYFREGYSFKVFDCSSLDKNISEVFVDSKNSKSEFSHVKKESSPSKHPAFKKPPPQTSSHLQDKKATTFLSSSDFSMDDSFFSEGIFKSGKKFKNILFKTSLGKDLHLFLQKLAFLPDSKLEPLLESRDEETKQKLKKALNYVLNLKKPPISLGLKNGFSEWSFQFKKEHIILQGRIDLWFEQDSCIHIVDYKSSPSSHVQKQLIFYSWILEQMRGSDKIFMHECYPLDEKTISTLYDSNHKKQFETWLNQELKK